MTALDPLAHHFHDLADRANDAHDHDELHAAGEIVELIAKGALAIPGEESYVGRWLRALQEPVHVKRFDPPLQVEVDDE